MQNNINCLAPETGNRNLTNYHTGGSIPSTPLGQFCYDFEFTHLMQKFKAKALRFIYAAREFAPPPSEAFSDTVIDCFLPIEKIVLLSKTNFDQPSGFVLQGVILPSLNSFVCDLNDTVILPSEKYKARIHTKLYLDDNGFVSTVDRSFNDYSSAVPDPGTLNEPYDIYRRKQNPFNIPSPILRGLLPGGVGAPNLFKVILYYEYDNNIDTEIIDQRIIRPVTADAR
jgi:hypothetical protein